ncbi:MAG: class I SAM-dependent methyltransferase [Desulfovibrio sp.]|nr:class I SAM-dependent methyltransferase [Desulfovibrio sp.]
MLNNSQYASSNKYEARIYLSRKFKINPKSKYEWIFDHFPKKENLNVLELGCGTGLFWLANRNNIIKSWSIILSDYSEGMLETARNSLSRINYNFQYEIVNAENILYSDNTFDIILANNMLYHIQNRDEAIKNIRRILKDDGVFVVSTMGKNDISELHNHLYTFLETKNNKFRFKEFSFSLDNGIEQLIKYFKNVVMEKYENKLEINETEAIINYYLSFNEIYDNVIILPEEYINGFRTYLQNILEKEKLITATKDEGIFICKK